MKKKLAIIASVVVITGAIGFGAFKITSSQNKTQEQQVQVDTVTTKTMVSTVDADGIVAFRDKISVYAKNTGKVINLPKKEGDSVNQGDILVNYDKSSLETLQRQLSDAQLSLKSANLALESLMLPTDDSQIKQLEAQISQSEKTILDLQNNLTQLDTDILKAQSDLDAGKMLFEQGAISKNDLDNYEKALTNLQNQKTSAQNSLDAAQKQLDANKAQYENAKNKNQDPNTKNKIESQKVIVSQAQNKVNQLTEDINDFEIASVSPITGTVVKLYVTDGEAVTEGKIVAEVGNLNDLVIEAYIPEYDMDGVAVSQEVLIKSDITDQQFKGQITKVYPLAETKNIGGSEKSVVKVEISMPSDTPLKAGYTTDLTITTKVEENALVIPIMAYMTEKVDDENKEYVYVVKDDNTLEKRYIKIKTIKNAFASVEGLNEGEKVVSAPTETMTEGTKISPIDNTTTKDLQIEQNTKPNM